MLGCGCVDDSMLGCGCVDDSCWVVVVVVDDSCWVVVVWMIHVGCGCELWLQYDDSGLEEAFIDSGCSGSTGS